jgi:hypothetical protein
MGLEHGELHDVDVLARGGLLEELLEKGSRGRVDHRLSIERRPNEVNKELMR